MLTLAVILSTCISAFGTVYANDTIALTARIYEMVNNKFSFYGNNTSASIENIKFYE